MLGARRIAGAVFLVAYLAGCSFYPPPQGVSNAGPNGLDGIESHYHINALDPQSPIPLTKQTLEELQKTDFFRLLDGTTYGLAQGNRLPANWLIQTPNVWNLPAAAVAYVPLDCANCDPDFHLPACQKPPDCEFNPCLPLQASVSRPGMRVRSFCVGQADMVIDRYYNLIRSAEHSVDVTMLQPAADFRFLAALRNAITWLAYSGRDVTMRVMIGNYPPAGTDVLAFLHELNRDTAAAPNSRLNIYVGTTRSCDGVQPCDTLSWNHSKIVAVDGERAILGGENMWTKDYLLADPVHDLSMEVAGPAAHIAHRFADALWQFVCSRPSDDPLNLSYKAETGQREIERGCLSHIELPHEKRGNGGVPILAVGRLAAGIKTGFDDQSLIARDLIWGAATHTIRMVQQDVGFSAFNGADQSWPDSALEKLSDLLTVKHGDVYIVLSNYAAAGPTGDYSNKIPLEAVANHIRDLVKARSGMTEPALSALLCQHLHLAPLRFGPDAMWPDGRPIGVHAKFWMVDDNIFYIGSDNLYPVDLQEFGFIVEDHNASSELLNSYWNHAWQWSRTAAISGDDAPSCVFNPAKSKS